MLLAFCCSPLVLLSGSATLPDVDAEHRRAVGSLPRVRPRHHQRRRAESTVFDDAAWRRLSVPALFLVGEHEKIYSPRAAIRRLERVAPSVRAEIVPGAGHDLTLVQPELVAAKVLDFLAV